MDEKLVMIYEAFEGKLVGSKRMKWHVCETLARMTPEIIARITRYCWFLSTFDDAWAFAFDGNDIKNQHLVFLSDDLLAQDASQIRYTIAHEIGHVVLGHKNAVLQKQTKKDIKKQETEADRFAKQYAY